MRAVLTLLASMSPLLLPDIRGPQHDLISLLSLCAQVAKEELRVDYDI